MTGIQALLQEAVKAKQSVEEAEKKQKIAVKSLEQRKQRKIRKSHGGRLNQKKES